MDKIRKITVTMADGKSWYTTTLAITRKEAAECVLTVCDDNDIDDTQIVKWTINPPLRRWK